MFNEFYENNYKLIRKVSNKYYSTSELKNFIDLEDFTQLVNIKLFNNLNNYDENKSTMFSYLDMVAKTVLREELQKLKREKRRSDINCYYIDSVVNDDDLSFELVDSYELENDYVENTLNSEILNKLYSLLKTDLDKNIMILLLNEKSYSEIGEILEITRSRVQATLIKLQRLIKKHNIKRVF
ncbi:MAG: sigma-70 family RNA polymerase sigma factor [Paraclostridium sp.]